MISTELFPYENHPYRLEFGEKKNPTICFFSCEEHLQKYLTRYKLDTKTVKIDYRDEKPTKPSEKRKRSVEQKPEPKSKGSSGTVRKRKPRVDTSRNTTSTTKRKK
jgi:hypothetical protein